MSNKTPEVKLAFRSLTDWGEVAVVEQVGPNTASASAVVIPHPAKERREGVALPASKGELLIPDSGRYHVVGWKALINGGGNLTERKLLSLHGVVTSPIPLRDHNAYLDVLQGRGLFNYPNL